MNSTQIFKRVFFVLMMAVTVACQSDKSTVGGYFGLDTDLEIQFIVESDINPDEAGLASPLFIRMYELKSNKIISKADFIDIYERDKEILGADLIVTRKLKRFKPGESRSEHFVVDKKTKFVALYAEFLDFKESKFRLVTAVVTNNVFKNFVSVRLTGNELILDSESN